MHRVSRPPHTGGVLRQRPAGLVVVGNWLTLPRQRGHLAFPSTGRPQQNAAAQHLAQRAHTRTHELFICIQTQIHPTVWVSHHGLINPPMLEQKYKCMCVQLRFQRQTVSGTCSILSTVWYEDRTKLIGPGWNQKASEGKKKVFYSLLYRLLSRQNI